MKTCTALKKILRQRNLEYHILEGKGKVWALCVPSLGAKILGAGVDEENFFWIPDDGPERGSWCCGGQRTWIAPEIGKHGFFGTSAEDWTVPESIDPGSFVTLKSNSLELEYSNQLTLKRMDGKKYFTEIIRSIALIPGKPGTLSISTGLTNRGSTDFDAEIGLWNIIQAPSEQQGTFLIPVSHSSPENDSCRAVVRHYFGKLPEDWIHEGESLLYIQAHAGILYKAGLRPNHSIGMIGYIRPSRTDTSKFILIVKSFPAEPDKVYLDKPPQSSESGGDVLQIYNSPDREALPFSELECHAPATSLAAGGTLRNEFEISFFKGTMQALTDILAVKFSRKIESDKLFY